jgi:hypothetical protein
MNNATRSSSMDVPSYLPVIPGNEGTLSGQGDEIPSLHAVSQLKLELRENVDDSLKKNMVGFYRKLSVLEGQMNELQMTVVRQSDKVISAVREGPHELISDLVRRCLRTSSNCTNR